MPQQPKNITKQRFNRLIAIKPIEKRGIYWYWLFKCDCGNEKVLRKNVVTCKIEPVRSCGCLLKESAKQNGLKSATHQMTRTRFYGRWNAMKRRCKNPNVERYPQYGGRGIKVSKEWQDFTNFMKDMYKSLLAHRREYGTQNTSIDRIDNNGN